MLMLITMIYPVIMSNASSSDKIPVILDTDIGGRLFKGKAPEGTIYPYVVFFLVSDIPANTFTESLEDIMIQFSLFSSLPSSGEIEDMFTHLKTLYDNCSLNITGSALLYMVRQNAMLMTEEHITLSGTMDVLHYAVDFSLMTTVN